MRYWALVPILGLTLWATIATPYLTYHHQAPIRSDGIGYYAWTPAIVQGNFDFCQWGQLDGVGAISARNKAHSQRCENKYTPALALLRFPVMGPLDAAEDPVLRHRLAISSAEERATLWLGALSLLITAICMLATMGKLDVNPVAAGLVTLAACFGTGLFHYDTYDASFSQGDSAALFAALVLLGVSAARRRALPNRVALFGLSLFIAWIRLPDGLPLLALVGAWLAWQVWPLECRVRRRHLLRVCVPVAAALICVIGFQVLYNHWASGTWTLSSYGAETFTPGAFNEGRVIISSNHGVLLWYPVLAEMLLAALVTRATRPWGVVALVVVLLLTVVYGSWNEWYLGGGFGQRGFVDVVPVVAVAGAVGISTLGRRGQLMWFVGLACATLVTIELMTAYWQGHVPYLGTTLHNYWQYIGGSRSFFSG